MEALCVQPWEEEEVTVRVRELELEKRGEQEVSEVSEASSPAASTADEDTDEDSEPEPPPVNRRKVSFADAFGLDLVSVKEFDKNEVKEQEEKKATRPLGDFYMTCLFTVPSTPEELDQRLQAQMVELESIGLQPGTTLIRGTIRVVNLCYHKTVHVRVSLDRWQSCFDLLAAYVPGSSDRNTDRFTFQYALAPPFEREGTRVEICLRYDTSVGTFWANNRDMNYVLFCHQKGDANERGPQAREEGGGDGEGDGGYRSWRSKKSCLKASWRASAEGKTRGPGYASYASPVVAQEADGELTDGAEAQPARKASVDGAKSRGGATRLARVQDRPALGSQRAPKARSHDSAGRREMCQPLATRRRDSAGFLRKGPRRRSDDDGPPRLLTYHEIPLLTLDWNVSKSRRCSDVRSAGAKASPTNAPAESMHDAPSVNDAWEMFCNGAGDTADKELSVCEEWQRVLNGSSEAGYSGVPESEWLQTAASVSPSRRERDFPPGPDATGTSSHAHVSVSCQLPADNVASDKARHETAQPCVGRPADDNAGTWDASRRRSEANLVTDTQTPASEDSGENSTERHKHAAWGRAGERVVDGAGGAGGDDLATESRERIKVLVGGPGTPGPPPPDECDPIPLEETEGRRSDDTQGQEEEDVAERHTSAEPETSERAEEDMSCRGEDERVAMEPVGGLTGDAGTSPPAQFNGQELSAEVESSPRVQWGELSGGTREKIAPLDTMEPGLGKMSIGRLGDDLLKGIWEEVFNLRAQVSNRDLNAAGGRSEKLADVPDSSQDCPSSEKDLKDAFESGVFASTETPSLSRGLEQTSAAKSVELSPGDRGRPVTAAEQTHFLPEFLESDASEATASTSAAPSDRSNRPQLRERPVTRQEAARQTEERVVARQESFDPSDRHGYKPPRSSSSERSKESLWWSVFYVMVHVTRLLIGGLLVAGFFYVVCLCDVPAFFALYVFPLGWWLYKWRGRRATPSSKATAE